MRFKIRDRLEVKWNVLVSAQLFISFILLDGTFLQWRQQKHKRTLFVSNSWLFESCALGNATTHYYVTGIVVVTVDSKSQGQGFDSIWWRQQTHYCILRTTKLYKTKVNITSTIRYSVTTASNFYLGLKGCHKVNRSRVQGFISSFYVRQFIPSIIWLYQWPVS